MSNVFFVHNAFSFVVAIFLIERLGLEKPKIVFAHKKAFEIVSQIKKIFDLNGISIISYSGFFPPLLKVGVVENLYMSNPSHPRLFPFFMHRMFCGDVMLIDDGFATKNNNYRSDIQPKSLLLKVLAFFLHKRRFSAIYTIFRSPSTEYLSCYTYGRLVYENISNELIDKLSGRIRSLEKYERMNKIILILGSVDKSAAECFRELNLEGCDKEVVLKEHPNNGGVEDDLGMPVELFLVKYYSKIKTLVHCGSSSAEFVKMFFYNDIELIKL